MTTPTEPGDNYETAAREAQREAKRAQREAAREGRRDAEGQQDAQARHARDEQGPNQPAA